MEIQIIHSKIHLIRGERVILDFDLAELYEVETRTLKQAVRRNTRRLPLISCLNSQNQKLIRWYHKV